LTYIFFAVLYNCGLQWKQVIVQRTSTVPDQILLFTCEFENLVPYRFSYLSKVLKSVYLKIVHPTVCMTKTC